MKPNNQKANTTNIILIVILVLLLIGGGVYFVATKKPSSHPVKPAPTQSTQPKQNQTPVVSDETQNWLIYNLGGFKFKYPSNWEVNEDYYATPAQELAGKAENVVGLILSPKNVKNPYTSDDTIHIGGRQVDCQSLRSYAPCFTFYEIPIYTMSKNSKIIRVFNLLIKTITNNESDVAFKILFPTRKDRLKPGERYTIQWNTKIGLQIQKVNIRVFNTSNPTIKDLILDAENVPNTGNYKWIVPSTIKSEGPYLVRISFRKYSPGGTLRSWELLSGWSDPFYISPFNQ